MIDRINPEQLNEWFASAPEQQALVLDVREKWELDTASVKPEGFELLHIPMGEIPERLAQLDKERPIACLCHHGMRSMRVASFLEQNGFTRLANISGGIDAWSATVDSGVPRY